MADTGNRLVKPALVGTLTACSDPQRGPVLVHFARQLGTFVPGTAITYPWISGKPLPAGCYRASLSLRLDNQVLSQWSGSVTVANAQVPRPPAASGTNPAAISPHGGVSTTAALGVLGLAGVVFAGGVAMAVRSRIERRKLIQGQAGSES